MSHEHEIYQIEGDTDWIVDEDFDSLKGLREIRSHDDRLPSTIMEPTLWWRRLPVRIVLLIGIGIRVVAYHRSIAR